MTRGSERHPDLGDPDVNFMGQESARRAMEEAQKQANKPYPTEKFIPIVKQIEIRKNLRLLVEQALKQDLNGLLVTVNHLYQEYGHDTVTAVLKEALPESFK